MDRTRRLVLLSASVAVVAGCGGGGDDPPPPPPPQPPQASCGATTISANHGHTLSIPAADLTSTTDKTYNIQGSSSHPHTIVVTVAQLALIKAGTAVVITSSTDASHAHDVTVNCSLG